MKNFSHYLVASTMLLGLSACASEGVSALPGATALSSTDISFSKSSAADASRLAKPPAGFLGFCLRFPDQCSAPVGAPAEVQMTPDVWQMLTQVNSEMNAKIAPEEDDRHYGREEYWTIPTDGFGDCDDYVVAKRKALMDLGLPEPALRIALVYTNGLIRHAVLTVKTDKGNYVLDNLRADIVPWDKTDYAWIKRQDPASASGWVSLE